ncbi:hypothetical protein F5B22DRAFT_622681 [Xylaria bambusicola]|uniref:uncharacterized protein n=1 Tax=Xylaria bambusicola TaxID=326684 RepID=UPI002007A856|nr:uncharacterized protein F5B22DRAFT_622681 [Xylaria bambusicola]KAI0506791.1 hypothetical protein F5B22DRAFT_622681 [Xylaria bambusicola]
MLPRVIPHARIIAYNYESRWHLNAPRTRLKLCGEELMRSLHHFRTDVPERPMIFVAHSLGGLVILYGLLYADRTESLKYIPESTIGFMPLGTPFRGTKMQSLAKKVAWLMGPMGSHDGIITDLEQDGRNLTDEVHAFCQLRNRLDIPITCCFELYGSDFGKKIGITGLTRARVVEEESAHIAGCERRHLHTDHFKLNKFSGPDDRSYLTVSNELYNMCINGKSIMARRKLTLRERHFMVPFGRNDNFIGRAVILEQLLVKVPPSANKDDCQRIALEGLGGIGKTQIALEVAYQVRDRYPDCSVYWVPAVDLTSFEMAYHEIGKMHQLSSTCNEKKDAKQHVKSALSDARTGSWLLIIDNADDTDMLFTKANLFNYLPFSPKGSVLFTTRDDGLAVRLDVSQGNKISVPEMNDDEATRLLHTGLKESQIGDSESSKRLLHFLANLPLAIKQASAYMALNSNVTLSQYLEFCESSNANMVDLLSRRFEDRHRYQGHAHTLNPIATTWLISFEHISQRNPQAADYLKFICLLAEKNIPLSLLPITSKINMAEAVGLLYAYSFILERENPDSFDIHRLVRLAMQNWLKETGEWDRWAIKALQRLTEEYPYPVYENIETWATYFEHARTLLESFKPKAGNEVCVGFIDLFFNISESYMAIGDYGHAEYSFRATLELGKMLGNDHPTRLNIMSHLSFVLQRLGNHREAGILCQHALEGYNRIPSEEHPITLSSMKKLAYVLNCQGRYKEAGRICQHVLEKWEVVVDKRKVVLDEMHVVLDKIQVGFDKIQVALDKIYQRTLKSMISLGDCLQDQGQCGAAERESFKLLGTLWVMIDIIRGILTAFRIFQNGEGSLSLEIWMQELASLEITA